MRSVRRLMGLVPGTQGYEKSVRTFVDVSQSLNFREVCKDFLSFLPLAPARMLDAGAGAGQNSAALAEMGHSIIAIEPMAEFLSAARSLYTHPQITWVQDSLPSLGHLGAGGEQFEFILVDGVWHHLNEEERACALERLAHLLNIGGRCAVSLRNGPPGLGTHVFPTEAEITVQQAKRLGMGCIFRAENLPSVLPDKEDVVWARIVLQKQ